MRLHRNSQKRYQVENGVYFITTNTFNSYPYFDEDIFCDLLVENIKLCRELKNFKLFAYKINPDHAHLLIQPIGEYNISQIIHNIKRVTAIQINQIINCAQIDDDNEGGDIYPRLRWNNRIANYWDKIIKKYGKNHALPKFKWQDSFHDHIIRNRKDLFNHLKYIDNQWYKHALKENKYCFIDKEICV